MRNVLVLAVAQAFAACGTIVLVAFGAIVGTRIAPVPSLATLPLSLGIVGVAATTVPAALAMQRFGRKRALIGSSLAGIAGALLAAWATAQADFGVFCAAALLIGANQAFVMQYRFAATDYVPVESAGRAVSTIMLGTLAAALLGPAVGDLARTLGGWPEFTGTFLALAVLFAAAAGTLLALGPVPARSAQVSATAQPLRSLVAQPAFAVAVIAGVSSYAVMSFIMTATPISMHVLDRMSVTDTRTVISAHVVAMYLPSLASGWLTRAFGLRPMMLTGVALMGACVAVAALVDRHFVHYASGLTLLGIGWNLLFVAATTLLTQTYSAAERLRLQGLNDFAIFGTQALVSLLAGTAIQTLGWTWVNLATVPLLVATAGAVVWLRPNPAGTPAARCS